MSLLEVPGKAVSIWGFKVAEPAQRSASTQKYF
jgi:hypothetical protein